MAPRARKVFAARYTLSLAVAVVALVGFAFGAVVPGEAADVPASTVAGAALITPEVAAHVAADYVGLSATLPGLPVSAGDSVFVFVAENGSGSVSSVTDTSSDHFALKASGARASEVRDFIFEADAAAGSSALDVTVTLSEAVPFAVAEVAVSGVSAQPDDAIGKMSTGAQGLGAPATVITTVSNDLILEAVAEGVAQPIAGNYANSGSTLMNSSTAGTAPNVITVGSLSEADAATGTFTISGVVAKRTYFVAFAVAVKGLPSAPATTYPVQFAALGLTDGTNWSITLSRVTVTVPFPQGIVFNETNGTYNYSVPSVAGYGASPSSGTVLVNGNASSGPNITFTSLPPPTAPYIQHVVVIMLENQGLSQIWSKGHYEQYLMKNYGNATSFYATCHRSPANYMAMTSGSANNDCYPKGIHKSSSRNIGDLFQTAGYTWAEYAESMPSACYTGSTAEYGDDHSPFVWYSDVVENASICDAHVVNSGVFNASLAAGELDNYSLYIPNQYDDGHTPWSVTDADLWLQGFLTPILNHTGSYASPATQYAVNHTAFFVLYDEAPDQNPAGYVTNGIILPACQSDYHENYTVCGGRVDMVVVSPYSVDRSWTENATDYSVQSTIEWLFSLPSDGGYDGTAPFPAMTGLFSFLANGYTTAES